MSRMISTLEQLQRLHKQGVDDLSGKVARQQLISNRCEQNITTLNSLAGSICSDTLSDAAMMVNHSAYKRNVQQLVEWQRQQQALADAEKHQLQLKLLAEVRREKSMAWLLDNRRNEHRVEQEHREQQQTDAVSQQCWLRRRQGK
ncbi:flagellar FliJ family protein [Enterobacter ludwigii]|uniref:flagellar FliJ family protein n=1 Tax=Enterobacter ludwigii TaxID=299767 RepID=UPI003F6EC6AD